MKTTGLTKFLYKIPLVAAAFGCTALLYGGNTAEAEPRPDPVQVQRFLASLEAEQPLETRKPKGGEVKRIQQLVETGAVRAPSVPVINKLETVVARRLEG